MKTVFSKSLFIFGFIVEFFVMGQAFNLFAAEYKATERVEFAFVLLADPQQEKDLKHLASKATEEVKKRGSGVYEKRTARYEDIPVTHPHVSIGQYACLGVELDELKAIAAEMALTTKVIVEPMSNALIVTAENIFFDAAFVRENTNPSIVTLYQKLRAAYMARIFTKHPIRQALMQRRLCKIEPTELHFIDRYFQNWGTPEGNRIRPHFTLVYNYAGEFKDVKEALRKVEIPPSLRQMRFTRLGIIAIDFWGNPLPDGLIAEFPLQPIGAV